MRRNFLVMSTNPLNVLRPTRRGYLGQHHGRRQWSCLYSRGSDSTATGGRSPPSILARSFNSCSSAWLPPLPLAQIHTHSDPPVICVRGIGKGTFPSGQAPRHTNTAAEGSDQKRQLCWSTMRRETLSTSRAATGAWTRVLRTVRLGTAACRMISAGLLTALNRTAGLDPSIDQSSTWTPYITPAHQWCCR